MDFTQSLLISGIIASAFLIAAIIVFFGRLRKISDQLTVGTKRALNSFGIAVICLAAVPSTGVIVPTLVPVWIAGLLMGLIISQLYISVDNVEKVRKYAVLLSLLIVAVAIETIARILIVPYPFPPILLIITLPPFLITAVVGTIYVLRESPSPFTGSMLIIIIFTIFAAIAAVTGNLLATPQYFIVQVLPVVVSAGVLGSMLRPWRNIVTLSLLALVLSVGPALFIPGWLAGNMTIFLFTSALTVALICLIVPLGFFLRQALETRATTALYISLALVSIALLALTHGNNFSIANSQLGPAWDETILFADWLFGLLGVAAFTMAAIAASFSPTIRHASREIIIGFSAALLVLGHPIVRFVEVDGTLIQRWELDPLYLGIFAMLIVAFAVFFKLSYQLWKAGSGRAGLRFIFFMFAALYLGIVAMFADLIPLEFLVPLLLLAGLFLVLSSPERNPFAQG